MILQNLDKEFLPCVRSTVEFVTFLADFPEKPVQGAKDDDDEKQCDDATKDSQEKWVVPGAVSVVVTGDSREQVLQILG